MRKAELKIQSFFWVLVLLLCPLLASTKQTKEKTLREKSAQSKALTQGLIGQNEALWRLEKLIQNHQTYNPSKKPLSVILLGSHGMGKTLITQIVAENIFHNSPQVMPPTFQIDQHLEKALQATPKGGIIIFTHIPQQAHTNLEFSLEKIFDQINKEVWTSQFSKKSYNLSRHVFLFPGNYMEFISSEPLSESLKVFHYNRSKKNLKEFLEKWGVSESFLKKSKAEPVTMRPLSFLELVVVTQKILNSLVETYQKKGITFTLQKDFSKKFTKAFFSYKYKKGFNGLNTLAQKIFDVAVKKIQNQMPLNKSLKQAKIHLQIKDNLPSKDHFKPPASVKAPWESSKGLQESKNTQPLAISKHTPARRVTLEGIANINGQIIKISKDLTGHATAKISEKMWKNKIVTAYHEIGHAIANVEALSKAKVLYVESIRTKALGLTVSDVKDFEGKTEIQLIHLVAKNLGGSIAEKIFLKKASKGWSADLNTAQSFILMHFITHKKAFENLPAPTIFKLIESTQEIGLKKALRKLPRKKKEEFKRFYNKIMSKATAIATNRLEENQKLVHALARELTETGFLSRKDLLRISKQYNFDFQGKQELKKTFSSSSISEKCQSLLF